jgi:hypothetical protein
VNRALEVCELNTGSEPAQHAPVASFTFLGEAVSPLHPHPATNQSIAFIPQPINQSPNLRVTQQPERRGPSAGVVEVADAREAAGAELPRLHLLLEWGSRPHQYYGDYDGHGDYGCIFCWSGDQGRISITVITMVTVTTAASSVGVGIKHQRSSTILTCT